MIQRLDRACLASAESRQGLIGAAIEQLGSVDGLFNVGADLSPNTLGRVGDLLDVPVDVWHRSLDVDLTGYFHLTRSVLPSMLKTYVLPFGEGERVHTLGLLSRNGPGGRDQR